jgi:hypothetical protein
VRRNVCLEVIFEETVQANSTDFTPTITKLKTANPDIIYVSALPPFAIGEANTNYATGENYWMPGITYGKPEVFGKVLKRTGSRLEDYLYTACSLVIGDETRT